MNLSPFAQPGERINISVNGERMEGTVLDTTISEMFTRQYQIQWDDGTVEWVKHSIFEFFLEN